LHAGQAEQAIEAVCGALQTFTKAAELTPVMPGNGVVESPKQRIE
jgi:hypothetical protein